MIMDEDTRARIVTQYIYEIQRAVAEPLETIQDWEWDRVVGVATQIVGSRETLIWLRQTWQEALAAGECRRSRLTVWKAQVADIAEAYMITRESHGDV